MLIQHMSCFPSLGINDLIDSKVPGKRLWSNRLLSALEDDYRPKSIAYVTIVYICVTGDSSVVDDHVITFNKTSAVT